MHGLRVAVILALLCAPACSRHVKQIEDHQDAFASLSATTRTIVDGWLNGSLSGTFALTALDQTYVLVEQERSSLTATASMVTDLPRQRGR